MIWVASLLSNLEYSNRDISTVICVSSYRAPFAVSCASVVSICNALLRRNVRNETDLARRVTRLFARIICKHYAPVPASRNTDRLHGWQARFVARYIIRFTAMTLWRNIYISLRIMFSRNVWRTVRIAALNVSMFIQPSGKIFLVSVL